MIGPIKSKLKGNILFSVATVVGERKRGGIR
jgi:hypothetical protein